MSDLDNTSPVRCGEPTFDGDPLLTQREVAELTGLSIGTLQDYRSYSRQTTKRSRSETGPRFTKNQSGRVYYRLNDVLEWIDNRGGRRG